MTTPVQIVESFFALWADPAEIPQAFQRYFRSDTIWENVGMATTTGVEQAMGLIGVFEQKFGMRSIRVETIAIAAVGGKVLTERIDHMLDAEGKTLFSLRVMGICEVEGGKIVKWRDYFDTAGVGGQGS